MLILLLSLAALASGSVLREDLRFKSPQMVEYINSLDTTWKAGHNRYFDGKPMSLIRQMMGLRRRGGNKEYVALESEIIPDRAVPDSFDSCKQWPQCKDIFENIRDQSACGSCWAVGAASAMSDRICIFSKFQTKISLSADYIMSCCDFCGDGCDGGDPYEAWDFYKSDGVVTGGNFTSHSGCQPYPLPPCEHHVNGTHFKPCPKKAYPTPKCAKKCQSSYPVPFNKDLHRAKTAYNIKDDEMAIRKEIMMNGPVEVGFDVYEDFLAYKTGVYEHKAGPFLGGHAVRCVGWGVDGGVDYWLMANSWNSDWGDMGYFKIRRGVDECGIESDVVAGIPI